MDGLKPSRLLLVDLSSGLLAGAMTLTISVSMAALIFSGPAAAFLPLGIGMALISAVITGVAVNLGSSWNRMVAGPQSASSVIIAIGIGAICSIAGTHSTESIRTTIFCFVMLSSLVTGVTLFFLGRCRMGRLVRYIPYPVLGGFLSGTGWLIVKSAFVVMGAKAFNWQELSFLTAAPALVSWVPGAGLAILLLLFARRDQHVTRIPVLLAIAAAVFFIVLRVTGVSMQEAVDLGLVLKPFSAGGLESYRALFHFSAIPMALLLQQAWTVITLVVIVTISILLNASSLEMIIGEEIDLDRELKAAGIGNMAAALGGGLTGYQMLTPSAFNHIGGSRSRVAGLLPALICAVVFLWGGRFFQYFPVALIGGYLLYIGLSFLYRWLFKSYFHLRKMDYAIVMVIFVSIVAIGFMEGLLIGLIAAILLFTVDYSRLDAVRSLLSGRTHRSNVERPDAHNRQLDRQGERIHIFCLRGYLFFGSAFTLFMKTRDLMGIEAKKKTQYVVLDLHEVQGIDSSALYYFKKILQFVRHRKDVELILTQINPEMALSLERLGIVTLCEGVARIFQDLDRGLEWCEDQILDARPVEGPIRPPTMKLLDKIFARPEHIERFMRNLKPIELPAGAFLFRRGDPSDEMFFLEAGQLSVVRERENRHSVRYRKIGPGAIVGEMGFYTRTQRSAAVVATEACRIYRLDEAGIRQMQTREPAIAFAFQDHLIRLLSKRLNQKTSEITNLLY